MKLKKTIYILFYIVATVVIYFQAIKTIEKRDIYLQKVLGEKITLKPANTILNPIKTQNTDLLTVNSVNNPSKIIEILTKNDEKSIVKNTINKVKNILNIGGITFNNKNEINKIDVNGKLTVNSLKIGDYNLPKTDGNTNQILKTDGNGNISWQSDDSGISGSDLTLNSLITTSNFTTHGPATIGSYTLPTSDGAQNQVLKTDGNGVLTWQNDTDTTGISGNTLNIDNITVNSQLTVNGTFTISDYSFPDSDGLQNQVLKTDGNGNVSWSPDNSSSSYITTVGKTGSGADYLADGTSDDVQIQQAIDIVTNAGGGVIKILPGVYDIRTTIIVPKDPKIRIEGDYVTKFGYGGTELRAYSGLASNLEAIIKEAGDLVANESNGDHSHASQYSKLIFNGNYKSEVGLLLYNTDHTIVSDCKFVGINIALDGQFNGDVALADYAGGLRIERSSFLASNINIRINSHTQDWITDSWFLGHPLTHIQFISSNKIHLSNNEFNQVSGQAFIFDDSISLPTGSINITGGFIDCGADKYFWVDNRTHASSKGIIIAGVRMATGIKTKLFNESKDYQATTYTPTNVAEDGYVYPDFSDDVVLINAANDTVNLKLPSAATATKRVLFKPISLANAVTVYPDGSDSIEKDGSLAASYAFSEVNETVWLMPDSNKWRVLESYKPTGGVVAGSATENVTEIGSTTYTIAADKDIILVNAASNAVSLTLPSKASKYSNPRKNLIIKVISATNPVTVTAAGTDEIDTAGNTSVTISDLRAVTFIANSGSRWRTYSSQIVGGTNRQILYNNSGAVGGSSLYWDSTNSRMGILSTTPAATFDNGGSSAFKRTNVTASTSSGAQTILGIANTNSPYAINLRSTDCVSGRIYIIKDESGAAASNNITIGTEGSEKIDGADTYVINTNYGAITLYSNGTNWFIINTK